MDHPYPPADARHHWTAPASTVRVGIATDHGMDWHDLGDIVTAICRARRGRHGRRHHAHRGPTDGRLPRRSARTAGPRRRRHTR